MESVSIRANPRPSVAIRGYILCVLCAFAVPPKICEICVICGFFYKFFRKYLTLAI